MPVSHQKLKLEQVREIRAAHQKMLALQEELGLDRLCISAMARKHKVDKRTVLLCLNYKTYTNVY